jgi:hypothetical protein
MNKHFAAATGTTLTHDLRNAPTWEQLWDSEDLRDRDACFDGEEGMDFAASENVALLCPKEAAKAAQPVKTAKSVQQQQNIKTAAELEARYIQQQQQQPQM